MEIHVTKEILEQMEMLPGAVNVQKLLRHHAGLSKREIRQAKFREEGIRKNGNRCRVTDRVGPRDVICVCLET